MNLPLSEITVPFLLGVFSTIHCTAMCGGIMGAIAFGIPGWEQMGVFKRLGYLFAANMGRVFSYIFMGLLLGLVGQQLMAYVPGNSAHEILRALAAGILVFMGLYLAGKAHWFAGVERLGKPLWKRLEPSSRRLLPIRNPGVALLFGLIWGWLPCAFVYAALFWSLSAASVWESGLRMALFGAGTLPAMLGIGLAVKRMQRVRMRWQTVAGWALVVMGVASYWMDPHGLLMVPESMQADLPCVTGLCSEQ
ncbi:sulfite exporter TauE/SafE family protein [Magnetococcus sp. PR-3]|uniref:sulfite exporter TauE/SafE family protein n=1 Tax=Magnetococcus sp. PR-3 TaxID=3120355 RepID=UPI002FCDEEE9